MQHTHVLLYRPIVRAANGRIQVANVIRTVKLTRQPGASVPVQSPATERPDEPRTT